MTTLNGTLPELQAAYAALDAYARSIGVSIGVANFGALRTAADTNKILQYRVDDYSAARNAGTIRADTTLQQFRPIAPFGSSYHNYGAAFDVAIAARPSSMSEDAARRALGQYAPSIGLRWGGTFTNPDPPHFELAIPLSDAQVRYRNAAAAGSIDTSSLSFDLSSFLPGLTPSSDDIEATLAAPDAFYAGDDAGDIVLDSLPSDSSTTPLIVVGFVVAGVMVWAIRRQFFGRS